MISGRLAGGHLLMENTGHLPLFSFPALIRGISSFIRNNKKNSQASLYCFPFISFCLFIYLDLLHVRGPPCFTESCWGPSDSSVRGTCYAKLSTSLLKPACFSLCMGQSVSAEPHRMTRLLGGNRFLFL